MKHFNPFSHFVLVTAQMLCASVVADESVQFNRDVRAILSEHCFECHGPDADNREADLRLDLEKDSHLSAIVAGDSANSPLYERIISTDDDVVMPPPSAKKPLSQKQIATLKVWIDQGAKYEKHWAFMPIAKPQVPSNSESPIDYFVNRQLAKHSLNPLANADKATLLRRITLDLIGLPPTPEELTAFLQDDSATAYESVVDRLLASKHYGEHMALPWLEAARYADTSGYQADWERFMWPWRNWVIDAFNDNMPFDQFTVEQLAGDMLPNPERSQILATGFNRNHRINDEGGVIAAEYAVEYVVDRIDTTSTVWLGLTMGCCRCHDHKYDPLPQQDFYNMFALFNNVPEKGKDGRSGYSLPILDFPNAEVGEQLATLRNQLSALQSELESAASSADDLQLAWKQQLKKEFDVTTETSWRLLSPATVKGTGKVQFKSLPDGSFLRTGPNPATSTYSVTVSAKELKSAAQSGVTAIQLEALTDPSLTAKSLAASVNGNFVLSEVKAELLRGKTQVPLSFKASMADHSQASYPAKNAIDGDTKTGWAVEGQLRIENRRLILVLSDTLKPKPGDRLRIQLQHASQFAKHSIGRFRLSTTDSPRPSMDGKPLHPPALVAAVNALTPTDTQREYLLKNFRETHPQFKKQRDSIAALEKKIADVAKNEFVKVMVMSEMETPRETFVLDRGAYDAPNKEKPASADAPSVLGGLADRPHNRLGFAQWLVSDDHPLTSRVTVNRFWQQFFGRGLVETAEDFGSQGVPPSHPELLDWLANEFRESGWDTKALVRKIVTSDVYKRSSVVDSEHLEKDPRNIWLARAPRVRLSGYQLRDQSLYASGLFVRTIGGPSVKPYQPPGLWSEVSFQQKNRSTDFYVQDHGEKLYRRALYTFWKRSVAPPMLANFDAAGREMCTVRSTRTSTPLQALNLMNDVTFVEGARGMAQRMMSETKTGVAAKLTYGLALVGIESTPAKLRVLQDSYNKYLEHFKADPAAASEFLSNGEWQHDSDLDPIEFAAFTAVASVILNLDEVVVRQ